MASLRKIKKDIDYLVNEVVYDCYLALYFHPEKQEGIVKIMKEAVDVRNNLYEMANNPAEKKNASLVKKHFAFIRSEMFNKIDELFDKLGEVVKQ